MKNPFALLEIYRQYKQVSEGCSQKGWYSSKTVLYNGLWLIVSVIALIGYVLPVTQEEVKQIAESLSIALPIILTVVDKLINIYLRFKTSKSIGMKTICEPEVSGGQ